MEKSEMIAKVAEKTKGIHTAIFTTIDENNQLVSRAMGTQEIDSDGYLWFMTDKDSNKAREIAKNPQVGVSYSTGDKVRYVSVSGKAELMRDEEKIKEFWNDFYKAWFEGPEDPAITLIKVQVTRVEYWDMPGGKIVAFAKIATSAVTGSDDNSGEEHEVLEF